jgi:hypothetical protein
MIINIMSEGCRSPLTIYRRRRTINFSHMYKSRPASVCNAVRNSWKRRVCNVMRNSWKRRYAAPVTRTAICAIACFSVDGISEYEYIGSGNWQN